MSRPVRLRFGQEVVLDCGPQWGGDHTLIVGYVERTESTSLNGALLHSGASREYVLQDPLDAAFGDATTVYGREEATSGRPDTGHPQYKADHS